MGTPDQVGGEGAAMGMPPGVDMGMGYHAGHGPFSGGYMMALDGVGSGAFMVGPERTRYRLVLQAAGAEGIADGSSAHATSPMIAPASVPASDAMVDDAQHTTPASAGLDGAGAVKRRRSGGRDH
jgi:hypothetical protein